MIYFKNKLKSLRKRESLDCINLNDEDFLQDLQSGKFTILVFENKFILNKCEQFFNQFLFVWRNVRIKARSFTFLFIFYKINQKFCFSFKKPFVKNYPVCALFTVKLHSNKSTPSSELITLKTLIYQLDAALEK